MPLFPVSFVDRKALFEYETNSSSTGRWYFFLDDHWSDALAETDCNNKIAKARFSGKFFLSILCPNNDGEIACYIIFMHFYAIENLY